MDESVYSLGHAELGDSSDNAKYRLARSMEGSLSVCLYLYHTGNGLCHSDNVCVCHVVVCGKREQTPCHVFCSRIDALTELRKQGW